MISLFKQNKIFVIIILFATMVVGIVYLNIQDISESLNVSEDILLKAVQRVPEYIEFPRLEFLSDILLLSILL